MFSLGKDWIHKMVCAWVCLCACGFERSLITSFIFMFKANLTCTITPVCIHFEILFYSKLPFDIKPKYRFPFKLFFPPPFNWLYRVYLRLIVTGHMNDDNLNWLISICLVGHLSEITVAWKSPQLRHSCEDGTGYNSIFESDIPFWCWGKGCDLWMVNSGMVELILFLNWNSNCLIFVILQGLWS